MKTTRLLVDIPGDIIEKYREICFVQKIPRKHMLELLITTYAQNWDPKNPDNVESLRNDKNNEEEIVA